jgi:hypothetical protein
MVTKSKSDTRVQIMLNESQKDFLDKTASKEGISVSALIRKLIDQYRQKQRDIQLNAAVDDLYAEYKSDQELTALRSLDGEDFYETRGSVADKS